MILNVLIPTSKHSDLVLVFAFDRPTRIRFGFLQPKRVNCLSGQPKIGQDRSAFLNLRLGAEQTGTKTIHKLFFGQFLTHYSILAPNPRARKIAKLPRQTARNRPTSLILADKVELLETRAEFPPVFPPRILEPQGSGNGQGPRADGPEPAEISLLPFPESEWIRMASIARTHSFQQRTAVCVFASTH